MSAAMRLVTTCRPSVVAAASKSRRWATRASTQTRAPSSGPRWAGSSAARRRACFRALLAMRRAWWHLACRMARRSSWPTSAGTR
eukprot:6203218-Alexandrium_andersonii.AAC.1